MTEFAYYDPNDPSTVYVSQPPIQESYAPSGPSAMPAPAPAPAPVPYQAPAPIPEPTSAYGRYNLACINLDNLVDEVISW